MKQVESGSHEVLFPRPWNIKELSTESNRHTSESNPRMAKRHTRGDDAAYFFLNFNPWLGGRLAEIPIIIHSAISTKHLHMPGTILGTKDGGEQHKSQSSTSHIVGT